jgi:hypothetical protein
MKKIYFLTLINIFLLFFNHTNANADSVKSFQKFCEITGLYETNENTMTSQFYGHRAVDYAVEILKENPNSIEACEIVELVTHTLSDKKTKDFYNKLKEKHMPNFDNPDFEPAEKIFFLSMLRNGADANSWEENKHYYYLANKGFINMKENCKNSDYAALATKGLLVIKNNEERLEFTKYFLQKYPNHKYIPYIELCLINEQFCKNDPQKCIDELLKLSVKYKGFVTPHGWRIAMDFYCDIAYSYRILKDYANAQKYYYIIKKEAPNYWNLHGLKERVFENEHN